MKIIQITDIHIAPQGVTIYQDIDVRGNFERVLAQAISCEPDLLVISGDICYQEGQRDVYLWVKAQLDLTKLSYVVMPGNHDDRKMMAEVFDLALVQGELFFAQAYPEGRILFLDSTEKSFSENQWGWLEAQLKEDGPILVMMHHPPVFASSNFMDHSHSFVERDRFVDLLAQREGIIPVFCGHYHLERTVLKNNLQVFITPSTMLQIDPVAEDFKVGSLLYGFRQIVWQDELVTDVLYYSNDK